MDNRTALSGKLNFLSLGDIMQLLGGNGCSGTLRLLSEYAPTPGFIYFDNGNPVNASNGGRFGIDALYSLFGWTDGEFEFIQENVKSEKVITKSRMGIILDGLRMLDDGKIEKLGPLSFSESIAGDGGGMPIIRGPLIDYMYVVDEEEFFEGETIIEEGRHGSWVWVILEGVVEIVKESPHGPLSILKIGDGAFVGSLASFLVQDNTRSATAKAIGNVQLGVLDSQRLSQEYSRMAPVLKGFIVSLDKRLRQVTNRAVATYKQKVSAAAFIEAKKPYVPETDEPGVFFQIKKGKVSLVRNTEAGQVPLLHLYPGDFFGPIPFLDHGQEPDGATVLVSDDFSATAVKVEHLETEFNRCSSTFKNMIKNVAASIAATTMVVCDFFEKGMKSEGPQR